MRKYLCGMIAFATVAVFNSSCQKEVEGVLPIEESMDSIYLSKYVVLDTTLPTGQDTTFIVNFFYNSNKRIKGYTYTLPDPTVTDGGEIEYFYNGSDTLPYMSIGKAITNGIAYYIDTIQYSYANGVVVKDSIISRRIANNELLYKNGVRYSVAGNDVLVQRYSWIFPGNTYTYSGNVRIDLSGGNIISQTSTLDITEYEYCQLAYDDKINPLYKIDIHYPVYRNVNNNHIFGRSQKNNILSENVGDGPTQLLSQFRSTYTYRADGYPLIERVVDLLIPSFHEKRLFFYTSL